MTEDHKPEEKAKASPPLKEEKPLDAGEPKKSPEISKPESKSKPASSTVKEEPKKPDEVSLATAETKSKEIIDDDNVSARSVRNRDTFRLIAVQIQKSESELSVLIDEEPTSKKRRKASPKAKEKVHTLFDYSQPIS